MPQNVRNFWIELDVDGKQSRLASGPRAKDGGFYLTIKMRDKGEIIEPVNVWGHTLSNGKLQLEITAKQGETKIQYDLDNPQAGIITIETDR